MAKKQYKLIKTGDVYITGKKFDLNDKTSQAEIAKFINACSDKKKYPGLVESFVVETTKEVESDNAGE